VTARELPVRACPTVTVAVDAVEVTEALVDHRA